MRTKSLRSILRDLGIEFSAQTFSPILAAHRERRVAAHCARSSDALKPPKRLRQHFPAMALQRRAHFP
jgi:hypothetical protein